MRLRCPACSSSDWILEREHPWRLPESVLVCTLCQARVDLRIVAQRTPGGGKPLGLFSLYGLVTRVTRWHRRTFGDDVSPARVSKKVMEEAAELYVAAADPAAPDVIIAEEAADVIIAATAVLGRLGVDPDEVLERTLQKIEARTDQVERDRQRGTS